MGSIIKKTIKKRNYYYYVESKRVNGKPKYVNQVYLGTAEGILEKCRKSPKTDGVLYSNTVDFGDVTLLYDIASRLGLAEIINAMATEGKEGVSPGEYILTMAIHRALTSPSKGDIGQWFSKTVLPIHTGINPTSLMPQDIWNNTNFTVDIINRAEDAIVRAILKNYHLDTSHLICNVADFFTFTGNRGTQRNSFGLKGTKLKIIVLSTMITPDCIGPLFHGIYPVNSSDDKGFYGFIMEMKQRCERINGKDSHVTIVFDSADDIVLPEKGDFPFHHVIDLKRDRAKELFSIPLSEYTPLAEDVFPGQLVYRTKMTGLKGEITAVISYDPSLERKQKQVLEMNEQKARIELLTLKQSLMGKTPEEGDVQNQVARILSSEYMGEVFQTVIGTSNGSSYLEYFEDNTAFERIWHDELGKTVLFTDGDDFSNEEIIGMSHSSRHVKKIFKEFKNSFQWADEKNPVHIFTSPIALRLCYLLKVELFTKGISADINKVLGEMGEIHQITTFFGNINDPERVISFSKGSSLAEDILREYGLVEKYKG